LKKRIRIPEKSWYPTIENLLTKDIKASKEKLCRTAILKLWMHRINLWMATVLYVTAGGGGSNGTRCRLWKAQLQSLTNEIIVPIEVSHFPPGTSKRIFPSNLWIFLMQKTVIFIYISTNRIQHKFLYTFSVD